MSSFFSLSPVEFAHREFGGACLGDARRAKRLVSIGAAMSSAPGKSICELFSGTYAMNATYEFFKQDYAEPDAIQAHHRAAVRERLSQPGRYLLLEDTSDISYSGRQPIEGLAPAGDGKSEKSQAFKLHSVLAVRVPSDAFVSPSSHHPTLALMGLLHQTFALRQPRVEKQERKDRKPDQWLETDLWADAAKAIGKAPTDPGIQWIYVADRGADIIDHLMAMNDAGARFVVRAKHDRRVHFGGELAEGKLFSAVRERPALATTTLALRARPGRPARTARLSVSALPGVVIQSPKGPGHGKHTGPRMTLNAVRVWETEVAEACDRLEWLLLTDLPVGSAQEVLDVVQMYACRWLVEEFHKALKSGMGAERLQLEHGTRLMAAVAVMSIVALRLLDLRDMARLRPDDPAASAGFDQDELEILTAARGKPLTTVREVVRAVAKLGGFPGRKGDGEPGMIVLWRGFAELRGMKRGWLLAKQIMTKT